MRESKVGAHGVSVSLIGFVSLSLPGQFTVVVTVIPGGVGRLTANSAGSDLLSPRKGG